MRRLKLQMHITLDNFVNMEDAGAHFKWDNEVISFCIKNLESVDCILLGRKTAEELIPFWDDVATKPTHADFALGKRISELPKFVLSNTMAKAPWKNTTVITGDLKDEVTRLKVTAGKDILVYGGASFAASLIDHNLVDAFYLLLDPFRLGKGVGIFKEIDKVQPFSLVKSRPFPCGTIMLHYLPG